MSGFACSSHATWGPTFQPSPPCAHPVDVVVDELVRVSWPGLEVLHHVPVVGAGVLVAVVAAPPVGRDAVHPERVAHPRVGALPLALLLVLVQTL